MGARTMTIASCPGCQARYRVPASAAGKRTTCKKCGQAFRIPAAANAKTPRASAPAKTAPEPTSWLDDLDALSGGEAVGTREPGPDQVVAGRRPATATVAAPPPVSVRAVGPGAAAYGRYMTDVALSLVFVRKPGNILTFVVMWFLLAVRQVMRTAIALATIMIMPFVGFGVLIITGWYWAFRMNVVQWAAGGEQELPGLAAESGLVDDVVLPFFRMLTAYVFALAPALLFLIVLTYRMRAAVAEHYDAGLGWADPVPGPAAVVVLVVLVAAGLFLWPMMVLMVSCGGSVKTLFQLDLMLATILKSLPAYLITVLAVYVTMGMQVAVTAFVWTQMADMTNWQDDWMAIFGLPTLFVGINLYFDIVALRAIGFYYCHFKHKFAWSWG